MSDDLAALAADAYIYGFPLVFDASRLAGPDERFVSINMAGTTMAGRGACRGTSDRVPDEPGHDRGPLGL